MHARVGDHLVVKSSAVGRPDRRGMITDVRSRDGSPPYIVRWLDDDHEVTMYPGADTVVIPAEE